MYQDISKIKPIEILKGFKGRFVHTQNFTIAFWEIEAGSVLPEHAHIHEQSTQIIEGSLELIIDGKKNICKPGSIVVIPSNVTHKGKALTDCKVVDTFCPAREDYKF